MFTLFLNTFQDLSINKAGIFFCFKFLETLKLPFSGHSKMNTEIWNQRYKTEDYIYGKKPNDFLVDHVSEILHGSVLCLGEGEGRNAVFLASLGHDVLAVDSSSVGLQKAKSLALENSVSIKTRLTDLDKLDISRHSWDAIISIFCHLPANIRQPLHRKVVQGLKPGGVFILEAYTPDQLKYATGGPKDIKLLYDLRMLHNDLEGLRFVHSSETIRDVYEGKLHTGSGSVVQLVAIKPKVE